MKRSVSASYVLLLAGVSVPAAALAIEPHAAPEVVLAKVRRIYVDQLGGGEGSDQMRDMLITAIQNSGLFVLTENPERADAMMKGSSELKTFTDEHNTSDSIGVHASDGSGSSAGANLGTNSSSRRNMSIGVTQNETSHIKERRQEVAASVRLVDAAGDVIWSTTQESNGAKFRGALADVADKVSRRLADETKKARAALPPPP
jgi:hypothetical protein